MEDILRNDLGTLVNGFWMILVFEIGEMRHSLVCFGVMELVSHPYIYTCSYTEFMYCIDLYIIAGSGKTVLAYSYSKLITVKSVTS